MEGLSVKSLGSTQLFPDSQSTFGGANMGGGLLRGVEIEDPDVSTAK